MLLDQIVENNDENTEDLIKKNIPYVYHFDARFWRDLLEVHMWVLYTNQMEILNYWRLELPALWWEKALEALEEAVENDPTCADDSFARTRRSKRMRNHKARVAQRNKAKRAKVKRHTFRRH